MLEVEIQKLTVAIEALIIELRSAKVGNQLATEIPTIADNLQQSPTDDEVRELLQAQRLAQAERDQKLADLYKAEQAKTKRKAAKVTPEETKALVEAAVAPAEPVEKEPVHDQPPMDKIPEGRPDITETSLKTMALEIVRVDSSAREKVLTLLGEYDAKTFTQLSPTHHHAVHAKLSAIAAEVGSA
jgi:hypothetical protein